MKVTIVGPVYPYRGGIAHFTNTLYHRLVEAENQVQVISFKRQYPAWLYPGQSDKEPGQQCEAIPALFTLDPLYPWIWSQALQQIVDFNPDLVLVQWWTTFWSMAFDYLGSRLAKRGIPLVYCIHNVIPHEKRLPDIWLSRRVLSRGSAFITLSPQESVRLKELLPNSNLQIFQGFLPIPIREAKITSASARQQLGLLADQIVLLFFGIVRPYKGVRVLIEALGKLKEDFKPILIIAGEFWEDVREYQRLIERFGVVDQVIIYNRYIPNEEVATFFAAADIFVAPHIHGTQSGAIKLAMSYDLPLLVSDQISSDLSTETYPVYIHQAGNADSLGDSIRSCICKDQPGFARPVHRDDWAYLINLIGQVYDVVSKRK